MFASDILNAFNARLATTFQVNILAEDKVFPTAGEFFVKTHMEYFNIIREEDVLNVTPVIAVEAIIRTRKNPIENRSAPYVSLLDLVVGMAFFLSADQALNYSLLELNNNIALTGLTKIDPIRTFPQELMPDYFGSTDFSSSRAAGYMIGFTARLPMLTIPIQCYSLDNYYTIPPLNT